VTLVLLLFLQALGHSAREAPASARLGTARASRRPRPPGPGPDAPNPSAFLRSGQSTCSDVAARTHPISGESSSISRKQKKKTPNRPSVANGEKASEKPASEEVPLGAEAQARVGSRVVSGCESPCGCCLGCAELRR
jgi:hypothetical protein